MSTKNNLAQAPVERLVGQTCLVTFNRGEPPECGRYLVTDGDEFGIDIWWEEVDGRVRLGSQIGKPSGGKVTRRWRRFENIVAWAHIRLPNPTVQPPPTDAASPTWRSGVGCDGLMDSESSIGAKP